MHIITLSGVDGSGKSTQVQRLIAYYTSHGKKVYYLHAVTFSIAQKLLPQKPREKNHKKTYADTGLSQTHASWLKVVLRKIALIIDIIRFHYLVARLKRNGYDVLISDRFFFDTVINIRYLSRKYRRSILEYIVPQPHISLLLTIPVQEIMCRDRVPEQGAAYLEAKTKLFRDRKDIWNMHTIDAAHDRDTVFNDILTTIKQRDLT